MPPFATQLRLTYVSLVFSLAISLAFSFAMIAGHPTSSAAQNLPAVTQPAPPSFSHVFIVLDENHSYHQVVGATDMPYLNSLIAQYGMATNYYANAHPSIGNYFMLTTGATISNNDAFNKVVKGNNVVRLLKANNLTWKAYIEDLPSNPNADYFPYLRHHNPFSYLSDVTSDPAQQANMVDFTQLSADMATNSLPNYGFIVPNAYHQGHDMDPSGGMCANPNDTLAEADCWLNSQIDPLINYLLANNGLLILTWDEGNGADKTHGGGHVVTILVSNRSIPGYKSAALYRHQSTLRLMLQALSLKQFPRAAKRAPQMGEFFTP
jgi:hypothetical protein